MHCHCDLSRFINLIIDFINFNYVYHHQIVAKISLLTIQMGRKDCRLNTLVN